MVLSQKPKPRFGKPGFIAVFILLCSSNILSQQGLAVWEIDSQGNCIQIDSFDYIVSGGSAAEYYDYYDFSGHPDCMELDYGRINYFVHLDPVSNDCSFGLIFGERLGGIPHNYPNYKVRVIGSLTDPYIALSDDPGEVIESPPNSGAFISDFHYRNNTDGLLIGGIQGYDWTVIIRGDNYGSLMDLKLNKGTCNEEDNLTLDINKEYRFTLNGRKPSSVDVEIGPVMADAGLDTTACPNTLLQLGGNPTALDGVPPYYYSWEPAHLLNNPSSANPVFQSNSSQSFQLTVTDSSTPPNTATDEVSITYQDLIKPTCIIKDTTLQLNSDGKLTISPEMIDGGSYDNCDISHWSIEPQEVECITGEYQFTLNLEDLFGNSSSCEAIIMIEGDDDDCDTVHDYCDVCPGGDDTMDNDENGLPDCAYPPDYFQIHYTWRVPPLNAYMCHFPTGNPNNSYTIEVNRNDIEEHINSGDFLGPCNSANCDDNGDDEDDDDGNDDDNGGDDDDNFNSPQNDISGLDSRGDNLLNLDNDRAKEYDIYPNPSDGDYFLKIPKDANFPLNINVFSKDGTLVSHKMILQSSLGYSQIIDRSQNLLSGLYYVQIKGFGIHKVKKLYLIK